MSAAKIVLSGEDSLQVQFEQEICPEVNRQVTRFAQLFAQFSKDIPEIKEIVPTYCAVTVYFDDENIQSQLVKKIAEEVLDRLSEDKENSSAESKTIKIPVCYEDKDFAPDLVNVIEHAGLTEKQVIELHSSKPYLIYMMGFLPGFPYLGGMDAKLETPRLKTPRTKIPAGSVAIGGKQTGLYSVESPGGWQIIGRTPLKVFDLNRNPTFVYKAGDKIQFVPVTKEEYDHFDENQWLKENGFLETGSSVSSIYNTQDKNRFACGSGIEIIDGGFNTTVQDDGIKGFQKYGIGQSGVMDKISFDLANRICGNAENKPCLETTLGGPEIRFTLPCDFAITGAVLKNATLNNVPIQMNKKIHAEKNAVLKCGFATKGLHSYIAFTGGILLPPVFGSCSTNLKSKMGGLCGRKLCAKDQLAIGYVNEKPAEVNAGTKELNPFFTEQKELLELECVKSSQSDLFTTDAVNKFSAQVYTVAPASDRMGIRFSGESLNCGSTDIISDAIPFGSVQITSSGLPVVMAADRQTTGGYAKIACVTKKSMCVLAQAVPGTKVKFKFI